MHQETAILSEHVKGENINPERVYQFAGSLLAASLGITAEQALRLALHIIEVYRTGRTS